MSTEISYLLNGVEYLQPRQAPDFEIEASFDGDSIQPNVTTSAFNFVNDANEAIKDWHVALPTEGMPLTVTINDGEISISFDFYLDFTQYEVLSDVECEIGIIQTNSLANIDERSRGITMRLLYEEGFLGPSQVRKVPYVVENRKTTLEYISIGFQLYQIIKQAVDEVFKIVNIVSDIASIGIIVAILNLAVTLFNLVRLTIQSHRLFTEISESLFPPIKYHRGFTIADYLSAGFAYMGYDYNNFLHDNTPTLSDFGKTSRDTVLCPSKYDEVGDPIISPTIKKQLVNPGDGVLKPNDFGYVFSELLELMHKMFYTKMAVNGNEVMLLPRLSKHWNKLGEWDFPDTLIETALEIENGSFSFNYEEMYGRHYIEYAKDDSDMFTLTNVNRSIYEVVVQPEEVINQKHVLKMPFDIVEIPYALAVKRSGNEKETFLKFLSNKDEFEKEQKELQKEYKKHGYTEEFGDVKPPKLNSNVVRNGAMMVQHDYFSKPKIVYLSPKTGVITLSYLSKVTAQALWQKYHIAKSFSEGVVGFSNVGGTNPKEKYFTPQKIRYSPVRIPFGLSDFQQTILNGLFNFNEKKAKFENIRWKPFKDVAVIEFHVMDNWNFNLKSTPVDDEFAKDNPFE